MAAPKAGQVTVSATAQALASAEQNIKEYVVRAATTNAGNAYLGPSGVTTSTGHILEPGETISLPVAYNEDEPEYEARPHKVSVHEIYVIGTSGDKISWFGR